ncbi:PREDICTED: beta-parvin-like isoform X2 [Branchiostoma belcheri]|uniref:Beta-parvin-like isoform X2 n=1 Tax=Branchiostoma belcheri TaxID=7741 RepID=A0A6P5ATM1_BRABE|nr:PREDICTED: beta-parvin-like isoform X2 [Branchiostoma belcheri]
MSCFTTHEAKETEEDDKKVFKRHKTTFSEPKDDKDWRERERKKEKEKRKVYRDEVNELQEEGKHAIDDPSLSPDLAGTFILDEGEERSMIEPASRDDLKFKELQKVLIEWINDTLVENRIIVKDIEEDLFDGQILGKLIEKLADIKLEVAEVTQSEQGQKQKLKTVLDTTNRLLNLPRWNHQQKWSMESIHSKNIVAIIHLLVALAQHFRAPIRFPEHVSVNVVVVQRRDGQLATRKVVEELTTTNDMMQGKFERDAFDTLFDHAPDKLNVVKRSLITFVNKHLNKINLEVTDLDTQFADGVYLVLLMGLLEGYFVPLYSFHLTPDSFDQKVHNVQFSLELMQDGGLPKPKARPEDIVNLDLKATLRVLYNLFTKYKHLN